MNDNLKKALLAMDVYNRGYNFGIDLGGGILSENTTNHLANFKILTNSTLVFGGSVAQNIGFYAIAYQNLTTSEVIISYRGTDGQPNTVDWLNGYLVGAGDPDEPQSRMAFQFYQEVAKALNGGNPADPYAANISLTGDSLGGGLAGLVGAAYHKEGVLFNNMAFQLAAEHLSDYILIEPSTLINRYSSELYQIINGTIGTQYFKYLLPDVISCCRNAFCILRADAGASQS